MVLTPPPNEQVLVIKDVLEEDGAGLAKAKKPVAKGAPPASQVRC